MKLRRLLTIAMALLAGPASAQGLGFVYSNGIYHRILGPTSNPAQITGINDAGAVIGYYESGPDTLGFIESQGVYTSLQAPGSVGTTPTAINHAGEVVGIGTFGTNQDGFLYSGGSYTTLNLPGAIYTSPDGINSSGTIIGNYESFSDFHYRFGGFRIPMAPILPSMSPAPSRLTYWA